LSEDPLRLYLVVLRGAVTELDRAAQLAGAAAVACVREFAEEPALAEWRPRPGKVCLRARNRAQWEGVLEQPHVLAGEAVAALPPRRRSERGPLLEKLQAMSTDLGPPPGEPAPGLNYVLNPRCPMSSGKVLAQVAHAAVMAAEALPEWGDAGCPAHLVAPGEAAFAELERSGEGVARVVDAGLTEVPPGTVTVIAVSRAAGASAPGTPPR
jgi:Peptidyl-tRNA hydrolase PTH2